jgi:triphosphoribosyl-dephospho-CoA synthetase
MSAADHLGRISNDYAKLAQEYGAIAEAAAEAEALHKAERAKAVLTAKATTSERMSHAEAETRAEANERIAELYRQRLVTAAHAEATRERLRQLREQVAVGRSFLVGERTADQLHATGGGP